MKLSTVHIEDPSYRRDNVHSREVPEARVIDMPGSILGVLMGTGYGFHESPSSEYPL